MAAERRSADRRRVAVHPAAAGRRRSRRVARADFGACGVGERQGEAALKRVRRTPDGDRPVRPRILVVDDDDALCETIRQFLRDEFAVATAPHGAAALDFVAVHEPALILLDLRMPIMDGWSFVQRYRRIAVSPANIVLMSAANDLPGIAMQLGANGHLSKPFDLCALHACVATHADRRSGAPRIDPPPADRRSSAPLS